MKHFKDPVNDEIFAYEEDGSQDDFIKPGLVPISDEALAVLRASKVSASDLIRQQIAALEAEADTPRRRREAILGIDGGWLAGVNGQIEALRAQLG